MIFLFKGIILGFLITAPVGPIGILCARRTLAEGRMAGFLSGLGAATADAFYGVVAAFGLTSISSFLFDYQMPIRLVGGIFFIYVAAKMFYAKPSDKITDKLMEGSSFRIYLSTFILTITNPLTVFAFIAFFAGSGIVATDYFAASLVVIGVFLGAALCWLSLCVVVDLLRHRFNGNSLVLVNKVCAVLIALFGVFSLASILR
ncbi:MAG: LysE family transporter [Candidatus Taylorbacteria bacterium]|nr:LysE family transporter [Candidatus Taylorbacteria bacterium]